MDYIAHGPRPKNDDPYDLNTSSFERSLSKLSENYTIGEIGSMILKLWLLKDIQLSSSVINGSGTLSGAKTHVQSIVYKSYYFTFLL